MNEIRQLTLQPEPTSPPSYHPFNNIVMPDLPGYMTRFISGIALISCGGTEIILGIVLSFIGYGVSISPLLNGAIAIAAGILAIVSKQKKDRVIAFMVLAIITAVISGLLFIFVILEASGYSGYYAYGGIVITIILSLVLLVQMVFSIIGASFTCRAVCSSANHTNNQQADAVITDGQVNQGYISRTHPMTYPDFHAGTCNN